jgi:signal transduction histidine kinase
MALSTRRVLRRRAGRAGTRRARIPRDHLAARLVAAVAAPIRTKLLVAFATIVVLLITLGALGLQVLAEWNTRLETLARLQQKTTAYQALQNDNVQLRQLVADKGGGDIQIYGGGPVPVQSNESAEVTLDHLRDSYDASRLGFVPTDEEQRVLDELEQDYAELAGLIRQGIDLDRAGQTAEGDRLVTTQALPILDRLEASTDRLANEAEAGVVELVRANRASFLNSRRAFVATAAAAVVLALILGFALSSSLIGPVRRMDARLAEIASGDFSGHVEVGNRDELGTLAANLNAMNDELERLYGVVRNQAAALTEWNRTLEARVDEQAEELRASRARIVAAADAERRRIERNLHDGVQQHLVALAVNLRLARSGLDGDPGDSAAILDQLAGDVRTAIEDLRDLAHGIYPPLLRDSGLAAALQAPASRSPLRVEVVADGVGRHPPELEAAIYFCCLEALQNAAKHAPGASVNVRLWEQEGELRFEVADDGPGLAPDGAAAGQGLVNMRDRIAAVGGVVGWESAPGQGMQVYGSVPVP